MKAPCGIKTHSRAHRIESHWPEPPFEVALIEPEIPPNTGNIARLCAATGSRLHLVGPLGFRLTEAAVRRAGLDYWEAVDLVRHESCQAFLESMAGASLHFFSTAGTRRYTEARFAPGDVLVFGSESRGLPDALLAAHADRVLTIPIRAGSVRSLNLATCAGIALYEALRQTSVAPAAPRHG